MFNVHRSDKQSTSRLVFPSQNTVYINFREDTVCVNLVRHGNPLWRHCIDCCLVSGVNWATHILSRVIILLRNSLPSSWYRCRKVNAASMRLIVCSDVRFFGIHLAHNFRNDGVSWCFMHQISWYLREIANEFRNRKVTVLQNALLHLLNKVVIDEWWPEAALFVMDILLPPEKARHQRRIGLLITSTPYTKHIWRWSATFFAFKKFITELTSQLARE